MLVLDTVKVKDKTKVLDEPSTSLEKTGSPKIGLRLC